MQRAKLWNKIIFAALFCAALASFFGCSQQKRYDVLTFFFDGVPNPGGVKGGPAPVAYVHKPYAENKCGSCHASDDIDMSISRAVDIAEIPPTVCLKCHQGVTTEYPVMHGPVVSVQCLLCHAPHDSTLPYLLTGTSPRLCGQCHTPENMVPVRPEHNDAKADCLSCHFGHGGPSHGLLRPKQPVAGAAGVSPMHVAEGRAGL